MINLPLLKNRKKQNERNLLEKFLLHNISEDKSQNFFSLFTMGFVKNFMPSDSVCKKYISPICFNANFLNLQYIKIQVFFQKLCFIVNIYIYLNMNKAALWAIKPFKCLKQKQCSIWVEYIKLAAALRSLKNCGTWSPIPTF